MNRFLRIFRGILILVILIMALIMFRGSCRKPAISGSIISHVMIAAHHAAVAAGGHMNPQRMLER